MKIYFSKIAYTLISAKFWVFAVATWLTVTGKISDYVWLAAAIGFMSIRALIKVLEHIKK